MNEIFAQKVKVYFTEKLKIYWQKAYAAFKTEHEFMEKFMQTKQMEISSKSRVPSLVKESHQFYFQNVQQADWGNVYALKFKVIRKTVYAIYVTTDGDDGWVELYDAQNNYLGSARRYIELLGWTDIPTLRNQVSTGDFPDSLANKHEDTIWK